MPAAATVAVAAPGAPMARLLVLVLMLAWFGRRAIAVDLVLDVLGRFIGFETVAVTVHFVAGGTRL